MGLVLLRIIRLYKVGPGDISVVSAFHSNNSNKPFKISAAGLVGRNVIPATARLIKLLVILPRLPDTTYRISALSGGIFRINPSAVDNARGPGATCIVLSVP